MLRARWQILILIIFMPLCFAVASFVISLIDHPETSDFFVYWLGALLLRTEHTPYLANEWASANLAFHSSLFGLTQTVYGYPPHLGFFLAPLTWLPLAQAFTVWIVLSEMMLIITAFLLMSIWQLPQAKHYIVPILFSLVIFRPVWIIMLNGQLGALFVLITAIALWLWEQNRWFLGGLVIALLTLKTTFSVPVLILTVYWLLIGQHWKALLGFVVAGAVLLLIDLPYVSDWLTTLFTNNVHLVSASLGESLTIWGVAKTICGINQPCATLIGTGGAALLTIGTAIFLWLHRRLLRPFAALSLIIPAALIVVPYLWTYDQIMLMIPIIFVMGQLARREFPYLVSALFFVLVAVIAILLLLLADQIGFDVWSVILSAVMLGLVLWLIHMPDVVRSESQPVEI